MIEYKVHYYIIVEFDGGSIRRDHKWHAIEAKSGRMAICEALNNRIPKALSKIRKQPGVVKVTLEQIHKVCFRLPPVCPFCNFDYEMKYAWVDWIVTKAEIDSLPGVSLNP
jgi:hypothetical protein